MENQPVLNDVPVKILDNNQVLAWIKKWGIYPFQFIEAYNAVKEKTISQIEQYLTEKGLIRQETQLDKMLP